MKRTRAFKVIMSSGNPIKIDEEELEKVKLGINTGKPVIVKQGLINPNFLVEIVSDEERVNEWVEITKHNFGYEDEIKNGIVPLKNLMGISGVKEISNEQKKLE